MPGAFSGNTNAGGGSRMAKDGGSNLQPEFDKSNSKAAMVNYSKGKSGGEIQDELRQATNQKKTKS